MRFTRAHARKRAEHSGSCCVHDPPLKKPQQYIWPGACIMTRAPKLSHGAVVREDSVRRAIAVLQDAKVDAVHGTPADHPRVIARKQDQRIRRPTAGSCVHNWGILVLGTTTITWPHAIRQHIHGVAVPKDPQERRGSPPAGSPCSSTTGTSASWH
jgi:hypothetical protein